MDLDDHEDLFGDDDFDDLPPATLVHLEQQARLSTQHGEGPSQAQGGLRQHATKTPHARSAQVTGQRNLPSSDYGLDAEEDVIDLDAQPSFVQAVNYTNQEKRPDEVTQREQWRQSKYGQTTPVVRYPAKAPAQPARYDTQRNGHTVRHTGQEHTQHRASTLEDGHLDGGRDIDVSALQLRIQELEEQAQHLHKAAEDAKSAAFSKHGEVAIVRANQQKEAQEFERKMKLLQQQHAEEVAKSRADLDTARKEQQKFETNNKFLEHDLARETERARTAKRTLKDGQANANRGRPSPLSTPRKNKSMPLRDGFDDAEVAVVSPSKAKERPKAPSTPKGGVKRKRSHQDEHVVSSPILSFTGSEPMRANESNNVTPRPAPAHLAAAIPQVKANERFEFMQMILDHRTRDGRDRTLEALTKFYLPSSSNSSLASAIYDRLTFSALQQELDQSRLHVCDVLVSQWTKCLEENYYDPLYDITELLQYILVMSPPSLSASLVTRVTPLCQSTTDLIAVATAKALIDRNKNALPTRTLKNKVDPEFYLDILHFIATQSILTTSKSEVASLHAENFWSHVQFDFILILLHRAQAIPHISSMLSLLHHSILSTTFGSIYPDAARQKQMETNLVDRLTKLLTEEPQHPRPLPRKEHFSDFMHKQRIEEEELERGALPIPEPYTKTDMLQLRTTVLDLLYAVALNDHGGQLLATHRLAIGRLVRYLHESVVRMYTTFDGPVLPVQDSVVGETQVEQEENVTDGVPNQEHEPDLYSLHARQINTIVTILYHLNSTHGGLTPSSQDCPQKVDVDLRPMLNIHAYLESQPSSSQAYLVALSRIAFSETWGLEAGIDAEVAEMAHDMLDEFVSPEDGEGVLGVFESGRVSGV